LFDKNVTIYGQSNMCQFEHEGKKIKLLSLRPNTGQSKQTSTLTLLPTSHYLPFIGTISSLSLISQAYPIRKLLPPLISIQSHSRAFESASVFESHKYVHKLHKKISDGNK